jgi:hypothetical protein
VSPQTLYRRPGGPATVNNGSIGIFAISAGS